MAQKQFINYQADILSFEAREAMLGILRPGRFSGFTVLATNGTPAGGSIPLKLQHTGGLQKLPKGGSALGNAIGVMVNTQGVIIHEDGEITITITDNSGGIDKKYSIVYMEHEYADGVPGDNPAIFSVINGTANGVIPTLVSAYKRSIVGVIEQAAGSTSITGCTWHPRPSDNILGDTQLIQKLWGSTANYIASIMGTVPSEGVVGTRVYTEGNFITSWESITASLDIIDQTLYDLDTRPIDSIDLAPLSDNTRNNVSILAHGLMPKLSGNEDQFINGIGSWVDIPTGLLPENNLLDVASGVGALNNLGGLTSNQIESSYFEDTGWQNMIRGTKINTYGFNIQIRRRGKMVTIQGHFAMLSNLVEHEIAFKIPLTTIGIEAIPQTRIYNQVLFISGAQENRGMSFYVDTASTSIYLEVKASGDVNDSSTTELLRFCMTYIGT